MFKTLCMECAYIENLLVVNMRTEDPKLQTLMADNALKHVGAGQAVLMKKLEIPHIRRILFLWLSHARANLLHKATEEDL